MERKTEAPYLETITMFLPFLSVLQVAGHRDCAEAGSLWALGLKNVREREKNIKDTLTPGTSPCKPSLIRHCHGQCEALTSDRVFPGIRGRWSLRRQPGGQSPPPLN